MKENQINLVKICVGAQSVSDLYNWQKQRVIKECKSSQSIIRHVTRMRPKRAEELLNAGSLYWVVKGYILVRQKIIGLEDIVGSDNIVRCAIMLDPQIIQTIPKAKKPFQGWRYLNTDDAPKDSMLFSESEKQIPLSLERGLLELGIL